MHGRTLSLLLLTALLSGCDRPAPPAPQESLPSLATAFVEQDCGIITGTVVWSGDAPHVPPYLAPVNPLASPLGVTKRAWPNPNLPAINEHTHGVADAVVFLRRVEAAKSKPWTLPPVCVEFRDDDLFVVQGAPSRRGFVQRGQAFTIVSKQAAFESLTARGAAFFTLTLPDPDTTRTRRLDRAGVVELSSGVGRFWMRGHLFVVDHPYYARTDAEGRFTLSQVPAGDYELVCWHPNWHEDVREHDADTLCLTRLTFQPAAEQVRAISVQPGGTTGAIFTLSLKDFSP